MKTFYVNRQSLFLLASVNPTLAGDFMFKGITKVGIDKSKIVLSGVRPDSSYIRIEVSKNGKVETKLFFTPNKSLFGDSVALQESKSYKEVEPQAAREFFNSVFKMLGIINCS